jgi:lipoprotein-anchoring transpeptidase ErfK/SrfK
MRKEHDVPTAGKIALRRAAATVIAATAALALLAACATSQTGSGAAGAPQTSPAAKTSVPSTPAAPVVPSAPAPVTSTVPATPVAVNHCAGNTHDQLVKVSLSAQHMWLCHDGATAYETAITSGASSLPYDSTPTGNYRIQGRDRNTTLTLNTGKTYDVKYWIPFNAPLYGFHDSSWQDFPYGSSQYKTDGSHGCVHMPLKAIEYFYTWVHVGAYVQIRT